MRLQNKFSTYRPAFYPVLSLYSPYKPSILAPVKLQSLRNALAGGIERATAVALIGVRPNPVGDRHLWGPIAQSQALKILYVGGNADFDALKSLQGKAVHYADTFEAGVVPVLGALSN